MKIHYRVQRSSTLAYILSQINQDEILISTMASRRQPGVNIALHDEYRVIKQQYLT
jgi:hypothetical protein